MISEQEMIRRRQLLERAEIPVNGNFREPKNLDLPYDFAVSDVAAQLSKIQQKANLAADAKSWEMAQVYVSARPLLEQAYKSEHGKAPSPQKINNDIRGTPGYEGKGSSWLSNAYQLYKFYPDIFLLSKSKKLPYQHYSQIAVCSLPDDDKRQLLTWAEDTMPKQAELRQEIRQRVDARLGVDRPDFQLKVGNLWNFSLKTIPDGFDGGILPDLVANLIYYFTDAGDIIIDPMAGGDTTYKVVQHYRYFRERSELKGMEFSGPRQVYRADIAPTNPDILQNDIMGGLPWPDNFADFCLFDPPYYKIASGKYDMLGITIDEWSDIIWDAIKHIKRVLKPGGCIAIITDDYLRSKEFQPLAFFTFSAGMDQQLIPIRTIYNSYANFITTMTPLEMARAKLSRTMVNQMKIIHIFEKP